MAYTKHTWECDELITADKLNNIEDGIEEAISGGGGGGGVVLRERFATIQNVPAGSTGHLDIPISQFGTTDPDKIVIVSCEWNIGEYRANFPASTAIVPGYSIQRDYGANSWVRVLAKNNDSGAFGSVGIRLVYTILD